MIKTELIFLGFPASGKGTQAKRLSEEINLPHVEMGGMLRNAIAEGTHAGKEAQKYMAEGKLVPIEIVKEIIEERLLQSDCNKGFVLDGFPRSIEQAEVLSEILEEVNTNKKVRVVVIYIDVDQEVLVERIVNRRSCENCGKLYNLKFLVPKVEGVCDDCGGKLIQRHDDTEEIAAKRFETFFKETKPLIEYYTDKKLLKTVKGNGSVDEVYASIKAVLGIKNPCCSNCDSEKD